LTEDIGMAPHQIAVGKEARSCDHYDKKIVGPISDRIVCLSPLICRCLQDDGQWMASGLIEITHSTLWIRKSLWIIDDKPLYIF
jgi:hypothetical protein